jgi:hypothetical protein
MVKKVFFFSLLLLLHPVKANSFELNLSGSFKNLLIAGESQSGGDTWSDLNRLRLDLDLKLSASVNIKVIYDNEAIIGTVLDEPEFISGIEANEETLFDLTKTLVDNPDLFWRHTLYRIYLTYSSDEITLTVGRQRVSWGQTRIWNPTDLFNPVSPLQIEGGQRVGVDALNFEYSFGALSGLNFVYAPDESDKMSVAFRLRTNITGYDLSVVAGYFREDNVIGLDFAGSIRDSGFRGEVAYTDPDVGDDFTRLVLSWDYNFPNTLYLLLEYLYNDGNLGRDAARGELARFTGEIITKNKNFLAVVMSYELTPLIRPELSAIFDFDGGGIFLSPVVNYNIYANLDWMVAAQIFPSDSGEYEGLPDVYFTSIQWYF